MRIRAVLLGAFLATATISPLHPRASAADAPTTLVDWLKAQGQDASYASRKQLFGERFPAETYSGTAEQNLRLWTALKAEAAGGGIARPQAASEPVESPPTPTEAPSDAPAVPLRLLPTAKGWWVAVDPRAQRLAIDVETPTVPGEDAGEVEVALHATLPTTSGFVSAAMLQQKAKTFDDGLYAAVELAAQEGAGRFPGKRAMLDALRSRLADVTEGEVGPATAAPFAAAHVRNDRVAVPPPLVSIVEAQVAWFERTPVVSKPIGFYTWNDALRAVFRQDRMLQPAAPPDGAAAAVARALHADPRTRATYEAYTALVERLTNPFVVADYRPRLRALDRSEAAPTTPVALVPACRSAEAEMAKRMASEGIDPRSRNLLDAFVDGVRAGRISLAVRRDSGWYDRQQWALEPFVRPEVAVESPRIEWSDAYRDRMEQLFRGTLALTRETHVKSLEHPAIGSPIGPFVPRVSPDLTVEPNPTAWLRRADSYRYVRTLLTAVFGAQGLASMRRWAPEGAARAPLDRELLAMEMLFTGAYARACREIGTPMGAVPGIADAETAFAEWASQAQDDVDLSRDLRMAVPVLHDPETGRTKVWVFLGWASQPITIRFATPPAVEHRRAKEATGPHPEVVLASQTATAAYPVVAEAWASDVPDRDEFRRLCEVWKTRAAILEALSR